MCCQDSTSNLLVIPLYVIFSLQLFALRASSCCKHDGALFRGRKSAHPPLWQTCMVLRPWVLFRETTVTTKECLCHVLQRFKCPKQIIGQTITYNGTSSFQSSPDRIQHSKWYHVTMSWCLLQSISYKPISIMQSDLVIIGKV